MKTWQRREHTVATQKVAGFTGEGAYHGSTKSKSPTAPRPVVEVVSEARPTTLERLLERGSTTIEMFEARFPNRLQVIEQLDVPSQKQVRNDGVTFCWCPFDEALREAGPVTRSVLRAMSRGLSGKKRFVYIDSKIQYFEFGDFPVDSCLWHVDGSIAVRDARAQKFGVSVLHDMRARLENGDPPTYMAYQSSNHCATRFIVGHRQVRMPELIQNFNEFDTLVGAQGVSVIAHPAGAVVSYDGLTLHRAASSHSSGWRLWVRCTETDVEIHPNEAVIDCYNTVFRPHC